MANRRPQLFSRVEPDLLDRVQAWADELYEGNQSLLVRKAIERYLDRLDEDRTRELQDHAVEVGRRALRTA
jgi:hypothetical protein